MTSRGIETLALDQSKIGSRADMEEPAAIVDSFSTVGGCSQVSDHDGLICSAVAVVSTEEMRPLAASSAKVRTSMEYVPTYLAYREAPAIIKALDRIEVRPDVLLVPAAGVAHPRGLGMARHLGYLASIPTVGITREPLRYDGWGEGQTEFSPGAGRGQLYVSRGWAVTMGTALNLVYDCTREHRLPEPLYIARKLARELRR